MDNWGLFLWSIQMSFPVYESILKYLCLSAGVQLWMNLGGNYGWINDLSYRCNSHHFCCCCCWCWCGRRFLKTNGECRLTDSGSGEVVSSSRYDNECDDEQLKFLHRQWVAAEIDNGTDRERVRVSNVTNLFWPIDLNSKRTSTVHRIFCLFGNYISNFLELLNQQEKICKFSFAAWKTEFSVSFNSIRIFISTKSYTANLLYLCVVEQRTVAHIPWIGPRYDECTKLPENSRLWRVLLLIGSTDRFKCTPYTRRDCLVNEMLISLRLLSN